MRPLKAEESALLTQTLELMRSGHHEPLGPFYDKEGRVVMERSEPTPEDPDSYLSQVENLRVTTEAWCVLNCFDCGRDKERWPCGLLSFTEKVSGDEWLLAEGYFEGFMALVFESEGKITAMEMC